MNKVTLTIIALLLLSSCSKDSIERRNDFFISSYSIDNINLNVTFKGSKWKSYEENGKNISEWIGPYNLYIYTNQPEETDYKITVSNAEIKYTDGTKIKDVPDIKLEDTNSWKKGIKATAYFDDLAIKLKHEPIIITLDLNYLEKGQSFSTKISLLLKPKRTERQYNSLLAAFMSV